MKKVVLVICFCVIAIAFTTTLIISSVQLDYAENHYEVTYKRPSSDKYWGRLDSGYGCGEMDCKYCNGKTRQQSYDTFVLYRTMNSLKTASIIILSIAGFTAILYFAVPAYKKYNNKE